jgi:KUP system potassium uptake protein
LNPEGDKTEQTPVTPPETAVQGRKLAGLTLAALGIVFGDIGTSPLYAIRECFHGDYGIAPTPENILGVLSLIFWSLTIVVSIKYLTFILKADNQGEGGVIALVALVRPTAWEPGRGKWLLVACGLFGASLLYGDGMITPAISVLSAVEGLHVITPVFQPYIVPITVVLLAGLFLFQKNGTAKVGAFFGPVILTWFTTIGVLGLRGVIGEPGVLLAFNPLYGGQFILRNHLHGFLVLGAVFLVVTGAEALYADLGHFGRKPIRLAWFVLVLPMLLLNYFGQGALLLKHPEEAGHPFYSLAPDWFLIPLVLLATLATIIASQAVISGAFSLTRQAIQLGYFPRLNIIHTSHETIGQVYVPQVNALLMVATISLVLGFGSSSKLAAAYGVAVTTTMVIATILFYVIARERWKWNRWAAGVPVAIFLMVDLSFFAANISKILHGAWFPLVIAAFIFTLMITWAKGRSLLSAKLQADTLTLENFRRSIAAAPPLRVAGKAVFLTANPSGMPPALAHNLKHNKILHDETVILVVVTERVPRVPREEKIELHSLEDGLYRIIAHFGFAEDPSVPYILALAGEKGLDFPLEEISFFLGRERLVPAKKPEMMRWRTRIFRYMSHNSQSATAFFHIPPDQVVELGVQLQL